VTEVKGVREVIEVKAKCLVGLSAQTYLTTHNTKALYSMTSPIPNTSKDKGNGFNFYNFPKFY